MGGERQKVSHRLELDQKSFSGELEGVLVEMATESGIKKGGALDLLISKYHRHEKGVNDPTWRKKRERRGHRKRCTISEPKKKKRSYVRFESGRVVTTSKRTVATKATHPYVAKSPRQSVRK